ncbi:Endonuclease [Citrus sinensis]|nr:Endonuclease [Citrus sinensis]
MSSRIRPRPSLIGVVFKHLMTSSPLRSCSPNTLPNPKTTKAKVGERVARTRPTTTAKIRGRKSRLATRVGKENRRARRRNRNHAAHASYATVLIRHGSDAQLRVRSKAKRLGLKATKEGGTMKAVLSPAKPIAGIAQSVHITLGTWSGKLDFSIVPMDDFKMVLGMEFFDQVYAFPLPATNSLGILDGSKACMVPMEQGKSKEKTLSAMQFKRTFKKDPSFLVSIRELNEEGDCGKSPSQVPPRIQSVLNEFKDVMPPEILKKLPPRREVDHAIELEQGAKPPALEPYRMAPLELEELRGQLKNLLDARYIYPQRPHSVHPCSSKRRKMARCGYLFDQLGKARYFTKLDLRSRYYQVRIAKGDEPKTTCTTRYGSFEFLVMPFGLTNAPHYARGSCPTLATTPPSTSRQRALHQDEKCSFAQQEVEFLSHKIASGKLIIKNAKVKTILEWESPMKVPELRSFLGLVNYYRHFIKGYSVKAARLTDMLKKNRTWHWSEECQREFEELKRAILEEPVLAFLDHTKPFEVQTDASDFTIGGVLMQEGHPIAFESRKLNDTERRYTVQEKEMTTIIHCLRVWRHYLLGSHFTIMTDNVVTSYFQTQKKLSPKQARWQDFLAEFDYQLEYKSGKANVVADNLSRKAELATLSMSQPKFEFVSRIKEGLQQDPLAKDLLEKGARREDKAFLARGRHPPHQGRSVVRAKVDHQLPAGLLEPLPLATRPWESVSMDFITSLPKSEGCGSIVVVVDRYSKYATFIAAPTNYKVVEAARLFIKHIVKLWGVPKSIVSDRDPRFTGRFWTELFNMLGIDLKFSTSFHPQIDGQTERINGLLEMYLRHYMSAHQRDWAKLLDIAQFSYNLQRTSTYGGTSLAAHKLDREWHEEADITLAHDQAPTQQFKTLRKVHKGLVRRYEGPFRIVRRVGNVSYQLQLPLRLKIHPVFHVSLLKPYHGDTEDQSHGESRRAPTAVVTAFDKDVDYIIADPVVSKRGVPAHSEYLVKWKNLPESEATWEREDDLWQFAEHIQNFKHENATRTPRA